MSPVHSSDAGFAGVRAVPRTSLFLPALSISRAPTAGASGADEIVVDLEDSIPADRKADARASLLEVLPNLRASPVTVRVNASPEHLALDLEACARARVAHVLIPKVGTPADIDRGRAVLEQLSFHPSIAILVESTRGVLQLSSILADGGPLRTVALGNEDLRNEIELGAPDIAADSAALAWAHGAVIVAARAYGVAPLGISGSLAEIEDLDRLAAGGRAARRMGYLGSYCVHPKQVPVLNAAFSPDKNDIAWAERVVAAASAAQAAGKGAFRVDGRMVDAPLIDRARRILAAGEIDTEQG